MCLPVPQLAEDQSNKRVLRIRVVSAIGAGPFSDLMIPVPPNEVDAVPDQHDPVRAFLPPHPLPLRHQRRIVRIAGSTGVLGRSLSLLLRLPPRRVLRCWLLLPCRVLLLLCPVVPCRVREDRLLPCRVLRW
jgi:hypothetical protein